MPTLYLPDQVLALTAQAADRLAAENNGDAALLYLGLLRHGDVSPARKSLGWTDQRCAAAFEVLVRLGLAQGSVEAVAAPEQAADQLPEYQRSDIMNALRHDDTFSALVAAVESALGKKLSDADLKSLYTVYDYLALPAEVIYALVGWTIAETERKYGAGRRPRMPAVQKTAFRWKRLGVDTPEAAEEYMRGQLVLLEREKAMLPLVGIQGREATAAEREYLDRWVDMGFDDSAIRLAYERTLLRKQAMNWSYMNSILRRWHAANLHTAEQAEAGDKPPVRRQSGPAQKDYQPSEERVRKNADWLDEFLAGQEQKKTEG